MFKKFLQWSFKYKLTFFKAIVLALLIRLCLKLMSFKKMVAILRKFEPKNLVVNTNDEDVNQFKELIRQTYTLKFLFDNKCLVVTTTFWFLMTKKGIKTNLIFGMAKQDAKLIAHAWLEHNGLPLTIDEHIDGKYIRFNTPIL